VPPPVMGAFSLTPGVVNTTIPWDYSTSEGTKLYFQHWIGESSSPSVRTAGKVHHGLA
jgi:hypothetical protein